MSEFKKYFQLVYSFATTAFLKGKLDKVKGVQTNFISLHHLLQPTN